MARIWFSCPTTSSIDKLTTTHTWHYVQRLPIIWSVSLSTSTTAVWVWPRDWSTVNVRRVRLIICYKWPEFGSLALQQALSTSWQPHTRGITSNVYGTTLLMTHDFDTDKPRYYINALTRHLSNRISQGITPSLNLHSSAFFISSVFSPFFLLELSLSTLLFPLQLTSLLQVTVHSLFF